MTTKKKIWLGFGALVVIQAILAIFMKNEPIEMGEVEQIALVPQWGAFGNLNTLTVAWTWIINILIILFAIKVRRNLKEVPESQAQNIAELYIDAFDGLCQETLEEKKLARTYFPLIATLFIFIVMGYDYYRICQYSGEHETILFLSNKFGGNQIMLE